MFASVINCFSQIMYTRILCAYYVKLVVFHLLPLSFLMLILTFSKEYQNLYSYLGTLQ